MPYPARQSNWSIKSRLPPRPGPIASSRHKHHQHPWLSKYTAVLRASHGVFLHYSDLCQVQRATRSLITKPATPKSIPKRNCFHPRPICHPSDLLRCLPMRQGSSIVISPVHSGPNADNMLFTRSTLSSTIPRQFAPGH